MGSGAGADAGFGAGTGRKSANRGTSGWCHKATFVKLTHDQSFGPLAGDVDVQAKLAGGVCPDGAKSGRMAFQPRADLQNQAIGWLRKGCSSLGGGTVIRFL